MRSILLKAKDLKSVENYKRMFISPDLTRKQQKVDKQLRAMLKRFRAKGESTANKIKYGKIVKTSVERM